MPAPTFEAGRFEEWQSLRWRTSWCSLGAPGRWSNIVALRVIGLCEDTLQTSWGNQIFVLDEVRRNSVARLRILYARETRQRMKDYGQCHNNKDSYWVTLQFRHCVLEELRLSKLQKWVISSRVLDIEEDSRSQSFSSQRRRHTGHNTSPRLTSRCSRCAIWIIAWKIELSSVFCGEPNNQYRYLRYLLYLNSVFY